MPTPTEKLTHWDTNLEFQKACKKIIDNMPEKHIFGSDDFVGEFAKGSLLGKASFEHPDLKVSTWVDRVYGSKSLSSVELGVKAVLLCEKPGPSEDATVDLRGVKEELLRQHAQFEIFRGGPDPAFCMGYTLYE